MKKNIGIVLIVMAAMFCFIVGCNDQKQTAAPAKPAAGKQGTGKSTAACRGKR